MPEPIEEPVKKHIETLKTAAQKELKPQERTDLIKAMRKIQDAIQTGVFDMGKEQDMLEEIITSLRDHRDRKTPAISDYANLLLILIKSRLGVGKI